MLVRTAVDTSALPSSAGDGTATFKAVHRQLVELIHGHAILVFASHEDTKDFLSAVRRLPQSIRKLWTTALPEILSIHANPAVGMPLKDVADVGALAQEWKGRIEVALFLATRAMVLGLPSQSASFVETTSDVEIARIDLAREAERFQRVISLASSDIPRNAERGDVWKERFEALATVTKTVTILDRYAVINLLEGHPQGLSWFLRCLDKAGPTNVHLIAQLKRQQQIPAAIQAITALRAQLTVGGIRSLSVTLANNAAFRDEAHSRHVRLGPVALLIDRGLATFDAKRCGQSTPCRPCDRASALEREQRIERRSWPSWRRHIVW